ncbi:MAG: divalent-cation tolerance protein CutA [Planctomycetaceae bacterium]|nr:divalent-cation tolerance protein CutA [Planctomycetaceae bacterium]
MDASVVYVTVGNRDEAAAIGRSLVETRLVACANLLEGVTSIYRWEDAIHEDGETLLVMKTQTALVEDVVARIRELHTYECPCVVSWPIHAANPDYLAWIETETTEPTSERN